MPKAIADLVSVEYPAWPELSALLDSATNATVVMPGDSFNGRQVLYRLQLSARSMVGAIVLHCGAILVDHGWVKLLGSGEPGLPNVATASGFPVAPHDSAPDVPGMLVAVDVVGGQYVIDGGDLIGSPGEICYWGPDKLGWTGIGAGHSAFLSWLLKGDLDAFYRYFRWPGWQAEVERLEPGQGVGFFPFPWSDHFDATSAYRRVVDLGELFHLGDSMASQIRDFRPPLPWPDHSW